MARPAGAARPLPRRPRGSHRGNGHADAHREAGQPGSRAFPGQIAETITLAEPLDGDRLELEGFPLQVIETGHTDTADTTALYVPDLGLIVSGDVAYNCRCR